MSLSRSFDLGHARVEERDCQDKPYFVAINVQDSLRLALSSVPSLGHSTLVSLLVSVVEQPIYGLFFAFSSQV